MTRLANMEIAGFYASPPAVTQLISMHIAVPQGGRNLDPCAGEGTALVTLAEKLNPDPFGVELRSIWQSAMNKPDWHGRMFLANYPLPHRLRLLTALPKTGMSKYTMHYNYVTILAQ